jgi:hypothetical protein
VKRVTLSGPLVRRLCTLNLLCFRADTNSRDICRDRNEFVSFAQFGGTAVSRRQSRSWWENARKTRDDRPTDGLLAPSCFANGREPRCWNIPKLSASGRIIADGVVHAIGVCLGLIGAITIVVMAVKIERIDVAPILVYVIGLVTMLAFSAAYKMWPVSPVKWVLGRFDHSAIYLSIAGYIARFR